MSIDLLTAALGYAAHGWHVFPLKPRAKEPATPHGFKDATTDAPQIHSWWQETPGANIGLHPAPSGLVVIDVDGGAGREAAMKLGLFTQPTLTAVTPRGWHLYFRHPDFAVSNKPLAPGVDVRGDEGYVVVPPSVHPSGTAYRWVKDATLDLAPDIVELLRNGAGPHAATPLPERIPETQRNTTLFSLAGTMRRRGAAEAEILAALGVMNTTRCVPPLPTDEVEKIAHSACRYPPADDGRYPVAPPPAEASEAGEAGPGLEDIEGPEEIPNACALLERERCAQAFSPPLLADFAAQAPVRVTWVAPGYAARDNVTAIAGHPKSGKTSLLAELAGAVSGEGTSFLGHPTAPGAVLWIDLEQPKGLTAAVLTEHCGPEARVYVQWGTLPGFAPMREFCLQQGVGLVVVDSLAKVYDLAGVEEENSATQVGHALAPLLDFARTTHVALVLIHHLRKTGGSEGLDLRGSVALAAAVDILVSFRRFAPDAEDADSRRVLQAYSRYEETAPKLVIERVDRRYRVCGTPGEVKRRTEREKLLAVLTEEPQTAEELAAAANMASSAARTVLKHLSHEPDAIRVVTRSGTGKKGDPFRYSKCLCAKKGFKSAQAFGNPETAIPTEEESDAVPF